MRYAAHTGVIPAKAGIQYSATTMMNVGVSEYWIARFELPTTKASPVTLTGR